MVKKKKKIKIPTAFGLSEEKEYFIDNMSMLVSSGMGILSALEGIREDTKSKSMKKIIDFIIKEVDSGSPLWRALDKIKIFSNNNISLIRIGEESGMLPENLKIISAQEEKERMFKSKLRSAMIYPVLVLSLTIIVGTGITWFILPKLSGVFKNLKMDLPLITQWLIRFGDFLKNYGSIAVPLFLFCFIFFIYLLFFFKYTKFIGQAILFRLPGIKTIAKQIEISRFGFMLGTLLKAGIPITNALESIKQATTFPAYKKFYEYLSKNISEGNSFQRSFKDDKRSKLYIPPSIQRMIISGEQSGNLAEILLKAGANSESRLEVAIKNLGVIFEPILLIIVWLGVLAVALAVILPIYTLIGGLNK